MYTMGNVTELYMKLGKKVWRHLPEVLCRNGLLGLIAQTMLLDGDKECLFMLWRWVYELSILLKLESKSGLGIPFTSDE